jgi:hypothetical protein
MFLQNIFREGKVGIRNCEQYIQVQRFRKIFQNLRNLGEVRAGKLRHLPIVRYI